MKDILRREIPSGALVIYMALGRDSVGMKYGVQTDTGGLFSEQGGSFSGASNRYWIEFPNEKEKEIQKNIIQKREQVLKKREEKKAKKKEIKGIPYKDLKFGYVYEDVDGYETIFWGRASIFNSSYHLVDLNYDKEFCYDLLGDFPRVRKTKVKLVKELRRFESPNVSITDDFCVAQRRNVFGDNERKITIYKEGYEIPKEEI